MLARLQQVQLFGRGVLVAVVDVVLALQHSAVGQCQQRDGVAQAGGKGREALHAPAVGGVQFGPVDGAARLGAGQFGAGQGLALVVAPAGVGDRAHVDVERAAGGEGDFLQRVRAVARQIGQHHLALAERLAGRRDGRAPDLACFAHPGLAIGANGQTQRAIQLLGQHAHRGLARAGRQRQLQ